MGITVGPGRGRVAEISVGRSVRKMMTSNSCPCALCRLLLVSEEQRGLHQDSRHHTQSLAQELGHTGAFWGSIILESTPNFSSSTLSNLSLEKEEVKLEGVYLVFVEWMHE